MNNISTTTEQRRDRDASESTTRILCPFRVVTDTREQTPWTFADMTAGADEGHAPYAVETIVKCLDAGDYSVDSREHEFRIERKTPEDLFQTLTRGRTRFERELERLAAFPFSAIVCECEFADVIRNPPSRMTPRSFVASVVALSQRFPTKWFFCGNRTFAERVAFRHMQRWHKDRVDEEAAL